jgi:photosystem II stability/assembly factor-like uncharacterized protein
MNLKKIMKKLLILSLLLNSLSLYAQWVPQNSGTSNFLNQIFFLNKDTGYVLQDNGVLRRTIDGGANWNIIYSGTPRPYHIAFTDYMNGHAAGENCILRTTDGGYSWSVRYTDATIDFRQVTFPNSNTGYIIANYGLDSLILFKTIDSGNTWMKINSQYNIYSCFYWAMSFPSVDTGYIVVDACSMVGKTYNGGASIQFDSLPASVGTVGVYFRTSNEGIVTGYNGEIFKTTSAGNLWINVADPGNSLPLYAGYFVSHDTGWVVGGDGFSSGVILKTANGGGSWTNTTGLNSETFNSIYFPTSNIGYTCGLGGVIRKYDQSVNIEEGHHSVINIFPNPATRTFTITLNNQSSINNQLQITDLTGRVVHEQILIQKSEVINQNFSPGVYFITVSDGERSFMEKLVVSRQ